MSKKLKVVTIGGGSTYTPELAEGFIKRYEGFPMTEWWLVDIEDGKEKLEIVGNLVKRMITAAHLPIEVHLTLNRQEALKNADFVTTQIRVGLLEARIKDERIPLSHGVIGQETNGAGGLFKALRTIPVILDIVKDMQTLCPDAWLINFANPSGMVTEAVLRYTTFKKVVGLCNVPISMHKIIAQLMHVDEKDVRLEIAGVNHHFLVTDCIVQGKHMMKELLDIYLQLDDAQHISMRNIPGLPWSKRLLYGLKALPCPYFNYYFFTEDMLNKEMEDYKNHNTRSELVKRVETELLELYKNTDLHVKPKQLEQRGGTNYSEAACSLIYSIYNDLGDIQYVDCRNNGTIQGIDDESAIEVACVITKEGPKPLTIGKLTPQINGTIQNIKSFEQLACEAAVTGDENIAVTALTLNRLVPSSRLANQLFDELLIAHKKYLPQFSSTITRLEKENVIIHDDLVNELIKNGK